MPLNEITIPSESDQSPNYLPFFTQLNCDTSSSGDSTTSATLTGTVPNENTNNDQALNSSNELTVIDSDSFSINQNKSSTHLIIPSIPPLPIATSMPSLTLTSEENSTLIATDPLPLLRQFLDTNINAPVIKWNSKLLFNGSINGDPLTEVDILQFVGKHPKDMVTHKIYFCNDTYSVKDEFDSINNLSSLSSLKDQYSSRFKSDAFLRLSKDLCAASRKCGFEIIKNGVQGRKIMKGDLGINVVQRFSCRRYQLHRNFSKFQNPDTRFRIITYHNDRLNQRSKGRKS